MEETKTSKKKNLGGRPPVKRMAEEARNKMAEVFNEANGDPVLLMQLMLKNGAALNLDIATALRMARELAPYERPKLSSIEQRNVDTSPPVIVFQRGDEIKTKLIGGKKDGE